MKKNILSISFLLLLVFEGQNLGLWEKEAPAANEQEQSIVSTGKYVPQGKVMRTIEDYNKMNKILDKKIGII